jgi:dTDP-4-dehydrorhamnose reductase
MARIVVIGGAGQVGEEFHHQALPSDWSCIGLYRSDLDLTEPASFKPILGVLEPDLIINAAGYTNVDKAEAEEDLAMQVNARAPGELAKVAADFGIPFLHISTDYVFDGSSDRPWTEDDEPNPINAYGRSKLKGERVVLDSGALAIVLRTSWVFSPYGSNFVKTMLRLGAKHEQLSIVADQQGGPTAADDIAAALITVGQKLLEGSTQGGVYHFAGQPAVTWAEFAEAIFDYANWLDRRPDIQPIKTVDYPTPARRPLNSILDCSKIKKDFDIAQPDWHEALKRTLNELKLSHI